jgi:hypothetical protein
MEVTSNPSPSNSNLDASFDRMVASQPLRTLASRMVDGAPKTFKPNTLDELKRFGVSIAVMYDNHADRQKALELAVQRKNALGYQGDPQEGSTTGREGRPVYYVRIWKDAPISQTIDDLFG